MTLLESANNFLGFFQRRRILRIAIATFVVLLMANLDSLVGAVTHPEVPYFDEDHLIVGAVMAIATMIFFGIMAAYLGSLERALRDVKTLKGLLPICSSCSKIRTPDNHWHVIEKYIAERTDATFTHGLCPECARRLYGDVVDEFGKT
ncbi:MAG: hypothetical protein HYY49_04760 [Ignavibacteriales bacterium]|nr:hypothetical protein [Ignavibacteriales bacterium]